MKNIILLALMFVASFSVAQQTQKTLLKTLNIQEYKQLVLDLGGEINVERWNNPSVRVQMQITYHNANIHVMKYLISKGRYDIKTEPTVDGLSISHTKTLKDIPISKEGKILQEDVIYTLYIPNNITITYGEEEQALIFSSSKEPVAAQ